MMAQLIRYKVNMDAQTKYKGLQKLDPQRLQVGMFIAQLDRDWAETDFALQGFYLRTQQTIERLIDEHQFVYVDPRRYDSQIGAVKLHAVAQRQDLGLATHKFSSQEGLQPPNPRVYDDSVTTAEEFVTAETTLAEAERVLQDCVVKLQSKRPLPRWLNPLCAIAPHSRHSRACARPTNIYILMQFPVLSGEQSSDANLACRQKISTCWQLHVH